MVLEDGLRPAMLGAVEVVEPLDDIATLSLRVGGRDVPRIHRSPQGSSLANLADCKASQHRRKHQVRPTPPHEPHEEYEGLDYRLLHRVILIVAPQLPKGGDYITANPRQ